MYAEPKKIKDLKKGEFFCLRDPKYLDTMDESRVWIRGDYDRSTKRYECSRFDDLGNDSEYKGDKVVYTGFTS